MIHSFPKREQQKKRHRRVRKKILGTIDRPRVVIAKSNRYLQIQAVDDMEGRIISSMVSSKIEGVDKKSSKKSSLKNKDIALQLGESFAAKAKEKGVKTIVFDRGGYSYHGKVKAVAEGMRKGGLVF